MVADAVSSVTETESRQPGAATSYEIVAGLAPRPRIIVQPACMHRTNPLNRHNGSFTRPCNQRLECEDSMQINAGLQATNEMTLAENHYTAKPVDNAPGYATMMNIVITMMAIDCTD